MRTCFLGILSLLLFFSCKKDAPDHQPGKPQTNDSNVLKDYNKDIVIANWNIEWFGDGNMFKGNLSTQETNAAKVLKYLNADLFGLCEIVDTARFGRMIRNNLGNEFRYSVSFYTSGSQKLAFVYNRNIFRNVSFRPFMGISSQAFFNFGTRYPYMLSAEVAVNGSRKQMDFILIHAKANSELDSYDRRLNGSKEMKDSLDKYYAGKPFMVLGDFNDNFDKSITYNKPTPYQNFLIDLSGYNAISWPLNVPGKQSTITYSNSVIDQQIISQTMTKWYLPASVKIRTDITNVVPDYNTGNTSDHYPVTSVYRIAP
ncbi:MAG: endonuclease/exonuclease/phosphatase [Niabella sp.]|nr:MAG: endonuclease/exonuclease/phosphatase [Niabella sp.]